MLPITDAPKLKEEARGLILDRGNRVFYSIASMWEVAEYSVAIKKTSKPDKVPLSGAEFLHFCEQAAYENLPIRGCHVLALESLPSLHADPFDRILVAQAISEGLTLLTRDGNLGAYGESVRVV